MSVFNLDIQNNHTDNKIVAGLERLSQVFRALLWEQAKEQLLSPIQIQLLIFIHYHNDGKNNVSYLAQEFSVTKPTISDAIKILGQKNLICKIPNPADNRRYSIRLTEAGKTVVRNTENYTGPISEWLAGTGCAEKEMLWASISDLIRTLNRAGIISAQRTCYNCRYYAAHNNFCMLLNERLYTKDIRIDCPEHETAALPQ